MHEAAQRAEFDLLMESQFWSAERIRDLQRERLERLLRHAKAHAPFYANRLEIMFRPNDSVDWDRWTEVPILKRVDLLQHRRSMLARAVPAGHEQIGDISTSGSTGRAVTTSHSELALSLSSAAVFRANTNNEVDYGERLALWRGDTGAPWPDGRRVGRWGPWWDERASRGTGFEINHTVTPAQALEFISRSGAKYALMGGTDARVLAYEAERLGAALSLSGIFTRGTDPTPAGIKLVARVFGASTFPLYSSKEGHRMAHRCADCGQWHVNDEQVLVEIVDELGHAVPPGQAGRVVITPFFSYAQPIVRYDQGDFATRGQPGKCRRGLSAIEEIVGRTRHMFLLPDGSRIAPTLADEAVAALNSSLFQIAQVSREAVEVRYVPLANGLAPDLRPAATDLEEKFAGLAITFRQLDAFDTPPGRKHMHFISELPNES